MWCRSYRNHVIMAFPSFDTVTSLWAPQANISWVDGPSRKSDFVRFAKRVLTEGDAVTLALSASRAWVDKRLRMADTLPRTVKAQKSVPRILTFAQFKLLMEKSGLVGSEQSLQKSYMALAQLRKKNHCSWAKIESKVKHSQHGSTADHPQPIKPKPPRLPLTLQDWRRVI